MSNAPDSQAILRANLRLLLKHDPIHNATSLSKEIVLRGKDYINDFLTSKDGYFRKSSLAYREILKIQMWYGLNEYELIQELLDEDFVKSLMPFLTKQEKYTRSMARNKIRKEKTITSSDKPIIGSFDPDEADDGVGVGESTIRVVGDTDDAPDHRPEDAISELVSRAGLGNGEEIETEWVRDGMGHKQVDALRSDYWRFPRNFLQKELQRSPMQLMVVECDGDSMEPTLTSGSRVVIDVSHTSPSPDGLYAIRDRFGAIRVKRLQVSLSGPARVHVLSDNPSHHAQEMDLADLFVIGRVVGAIRTF